MSRASLRQLVHALRDTPRPSEGAPSDADLLARFAAGDEPAFERLVRRHGPMVFQVCRRLLRHTQDAEDAFQATFLALARKAASVRRPEALAGWLHCTAHRAALRLIARRPAVAPLEADRPGPPAAPEEGELLALVEEEVRRLPEKYRLVVVLCYLEGRGTEEAAAALGCARGTVFSRLATARERLRERLARRGVSRLDAALGVCFAGAPTALPPACIAIVTRAAGAVAAGGSAAGIVPARVLSLTQGAVRMTWCSLLQAPLALLVGAAALFGVVNLAPRPTAGPPARTVAAAAAAEEKDETEVSVAKLPPVVVKAVPQSGDTAVDAKAVKEIKVTFSKDMTDNSWSWAQLSDKSFPKVTGKIRYEKDKRTCVLPVKLEPGKSYAIWVNSEKFTNFKDADGNEAVPYLLVFQTKR